MDTPTEPRVILRFGAFELDTGSGELREEGVLRRLPPQPFRVLRLLAERAGQTVTRQEIRHCLWGDRKYVDVDRGINFCLNQIRRALHDPADVAHCIKTLPRHGYCFVAPVARVEPGGAAPVVQAALAGAPGAAIPATPPRLLPPAPTRSDRAWRPRPRVWTWLLLLPLVALPAGIRREPAASRPALSPRDSIVIADFVNSTADTLFDATLKQALTTEMRQSPVFNVQSTTTLERTLRLMGIPDARVTPQIGRDLCIRSGGKALLTGRIAPIGSHFWISLSAVACGGGELLADANGEASGREEVLKTLAQTASRLRSALGESWESVRRFDVPADVTTTSLQALQSFTLGQRLAAHQGGEAGIPLLKRAIEEDPRFAMAYVALASVYNNLCQPSVALGYAATAYALRDTVSDRERLLITTRYLRLTGELERHSEALRSWIAEFPNDASPHGSLGADHMLTGRWDQALSESRESIRLRADDVVIYENLAGIYQAMNRPADATATLALAAERQLDSGGLRLHRYHLAFLRGDVADMQAQLDWAAGKPGAEDLLGSARADTEGFFGRRRSADEHSRLAADAAARLGNPEIAALWLVNAALRDAEFGDLGGARRAVAAALALSTGRNVQMIAALALARSGERAKAEALADDLERANPRNSLLMAYRLPSIRAAAALSAGAPARAIRLLEVSRPYDLALATPVGIATLYPTYLRGMSELALKNGAAAAAEFETILAHPGIALNSPLAALAHLQLARAHALNGDTPLALAQYRAFLELWKDADPDLLPLRAARREAAQL